MSEFFFLASIQYFGGKNTLFQENHDAFTTLFQKYLHQNTTLFQNYLLRTLDEIGFPCDAAPILLCGNRKTDKQENDEKREAAGHGTLCKMTRQKYDNLLK
jgi:hypothetical protein